MTTLKWETNTSQHTDTTWRDYADTLTDADTLPQRQAEVFALYKFGYGRQYTADELNISPNTVDNHLRAAKSNIKAAQNAPSDVQSPPYITVAETEYEVISTHNGETISRPTTVRIDANARYDGEDMPIDPVYRVVTETVNTSGPVAETITRCCEYLNAQQMVNHQYTNAAIRSLDEAYALHTLFTTDCGFTGLPAFYEVYTGTPTEEELYPFVVEETLPLDVAADLIGKPTNQVWEEAVSQFAPPE